MRTRYNPEYLKAFAQHLRDEGKDIESLYVLAAVIEVKRLQKQSDHLRELLAKTMDLSTPIKKATPTIFDNFLPKKRLHKFNKRDNNIHRED